MSRYAKKVDENQKEIVAALRAIGSSVIVIGTPVDLLVGYRARNFLVEVKNPNSGYGKHDTGTPAQRKFFETWKGQARKVYTVDEAINLVTRAYDGKDHIHEEKAGMK